MKVLLVGGGGREHAIATKLVESPLVSELICAPGNGGIEQIARCFPLKTTDIDELCKLAVEQSVDYVVVAPDDPLALGLVDRLNALNIPAFGPTAAAAEIEHSKVYSKNLMQKYGIPTAKYATFNDYDSAVAYVKNEGAPIVVKADGLALGKGVTVAMSEEDAINALNDCFNNNVFGSSGSRVVVEEYMEGPEVTMLAFCDGTTLVPMPSSRDHKRAFDGDEGPNTGGMGAISPSPAYTPAIAERCMNEIFFPTVEALNQEKRPFKGVIYFGLMLTKDGPKVIEYNARFGDPETQALLPLLDSDLMEIMLACTNGTLDATEVRWKSCASCCVVLASDGYPVKYQTGFEISGIEQSSGFVFHAGTKQDDNNFLTSGGRVLGVTALGSDTADAVRNAYNAIESISFENVFFRHDIGK